MRFTRLHALSRTLPFLLTVPGLVTPGAAWAQRIQAPTATEARAAAQPASLQTQKYTRAQLDQMLAPIALYPDQLLTQVLMAATFPQQVSDAQDWLEETGHATLQGDPLVAALDALPWDPSVKSLVAFPQIVGMLTAHMDWAQALGIAFANQQVEVMARVQFLRDRAVTAGKLKTTKQVAVQRREGVVIIEPADPRQVYVPVYNPAEVYGAWPDRAAPPVYIPPPPNYAAGPIEAGIAFGVASAVVAPLWGWGHPDWRRHEVIVDRQRYERITGNNRVEHRQSAVQNDVWHRVAPVVPVSRPERPERRGAPAAAAHMPAGTVAPTVVVLPPAARGGAGAPGRPNGAGNQAAQPPGFPPNDASRAPRDLPRGANETAQPGDPRHPDREADRPGGGRGGPDGPRREGMAPVPGAAPAREATRPGAVPEPGKEAAHPPTAPAAAKDAAQPAGTPRSEREANHPAEREVNHPGGGRGGPDSPRREGAAPVPGAAPAREGTRPGALPEPAKETARPSTPPVAAKEAVHPPDPAKLPGQPSRPGIATTTPKEEPQRMTAPAHPAEPPHAVAPVTAPAAVTPPRPAEAARAPVAPPHPADAPRAPAAASPTPPTVHPAPTAQPAPGNAAKKPAAADDKDKPKDKEQH